MITALQLTLDIPTIPSTRFYKIINYRKNNYIADSDANQQ